MALTKQDIRGLLSEQKNELVQEMDERFDTQEHRLRTEIKGAEKRLEDKIASGDDRLEKRIASTEKHLATRFDKRLKATEQRLENKIVSERNILQIFFDQQLRKTNGLIEDMVRQLKQIGATVTHAGAKQTDLEARVDKLEEQVSAPL